MSKFPKYDPSLFGVPYSGSGNSIGIGGGDPVAKKKRKKMKKDKEKKVKKTKKKWGKGY